MTLVFKEKFEGLVWKILEGNELAALGIELRSEEDLQVQYRVLELNSFDQVIYENEALDWWTGLQGVDQGKLWVKKFEDESDPSQHVWWSVDRLSGELFEEPMPEKLMQAPSESIFPVVFHHGTEAFEQVQRFMNRRGIEIAESVEYLEQEGYIFVTYYLKKNKQLSRFVYVMDKGGQVLMDHQLDENMEGVVFQSFFTYQNLLIFVENRNELHVYQL
ncbi:MAG: hypothetical protein R8G66_12090 [Cytophagales bacterium]|nr:hypothetical protein [Cytophagales bacterium]